MRLGAMVGTLALLVSAAATQPAGADDEAAQDSHFRKVTLNDEPGEPIDMAVLPDGGVLHTTRQGVVWHHDPTTGTNNVAARIAVYQHDEEGLQGIALDPRFGRNDRHNWVYVYYAPPLDTPVDDPSTPVVDEGAAPKWGSPEDWERFVGVNRLSRFRFASGELDLTSEQQIIDVPVDRGMCCHLGGDIAFDAADNLILSTGDDTNPSESDRYTPIDERPRRNPAFDAQRSSGNTDDLRGKLLRITPGKHGGYSIPEGNLFADGTPQTRPEIYAMGLRNPFRFEIDKQTGDLYVGDYSPDASSADPDRGPRGQGRWMIIDEPANYGWPYCATPDLPYVDYDFATKESGEVFDCANPVNESPHNTGLTQLPPVKDVQVHYSHNLSDEFPELGTGGIGPMGGPAYDFKRKIVRDNPQRAWPRSYDGEPLFYEWTRDYVKAFSIADGEVSTIKSVLRSFVTENPMDLEFGPDGALYLLEYGEGAFGENPDAQLSRIDYVRAR